MTDAKVMSLWTLSHGAVYDFARAVEAEARRDLLRELVARAESGAVGTLREQNDVVRWIRGVQEEASR